MQVLLFLIDLSVYEFLGVQSEIVFLGSKPIYQFVFLLLFDLLLAYE
jgi:hypothetical protein